MQLEADHAGNIDDVVVRRDGAGDILGLGARRHRGVRRATYANRAVQVPNDLDEIIRAIEVYS